MKDKNIKQLESFIKYCKKHPEMRFWQAIRNWSKAGRILFEKTNKETIDTFYWEGKNEGEIAERQHNKWRKLYFKMFKEWNEKSLKIKKE